MSGTLRSKSSDFIKSSLGKENHRNRAEPRKALCLSQLEKVLRINAETLTHTVQQLNIVGYYKDTSQDHDYSTTNPMRRSISNQRVGHVKGIEVSLDHEIGESVSDGWLSYAYTVSLNAKIRLKG